MKSHAINVLIFDYWMVLESADTVKSFMHRLYVSFRGTIEVECQKRANCLISGIFEVSELVCFFVLRCDL